eukprot:15472894-Alexandrium_andersonii.AAC.1
MAGDPSPLCAVPGFHLQTIRGDLMHIAHLGVCQYAVGGCLVELAAEGIWGFQQIGRWHQRDVLSWPVCDRYVPKFPPKSGVRACG